MLGIALITMFSACLDPGETPFEPVDNFDRGEMLDFWAKQQIVPALEAYTIDLALLQVRKDDFLEDKTLDNLELFRNAYFSAYLGWQTVAMFDIGKAEAIGYRNFVNTYPTDVELIENNITKGAYNLELPSNFDAQGFPALDYLLFGMYEDNIDYAKKLSQSNHLTYISDLVERLFYLNSLITSDWETGDFKTEFVDNNGSSATASTDKLVNDFLFYYEKFFRAGKIGIPAGVFSGDPLSDKVEAPYSGYSKQLCLKAFDATQNFFNGVSFDETASGPSLKQYLQSVAKANDTEAIAQKIIDQWQLAENEILGLEEDFQQQIEVDNSKMLATYNKLQKAVIIMKVEMMQALNIQIDYVDADGD